MGTNLAIGDITYLMADDTMFMPIEVKGGQVNEEIAIALRNKREGKTELYEALRANKKKSQQMARFEVPPKKWTRG